MHRSILLLSLFAAPALSAQAASAKEAAPEAADPALAWVTCE